MSEPKAILRVGVLAFVLIGFGLFIGGAMGIGLLLILLAFLVSLPLMGDDESETAADRPLIPGPERDAARQTTDEALATLRARYARGELSDDQFDRKLERLLDTETVEDAEEYVGTRARRDRET